MAVTGFAAGIWNAGFLYASYVYVMSKLCLCYVYVMSMLCRWMVCSLLADYFIPLALILAILIFRLYCIFVGTILSFSLLGVLASSVNFLTYVVLLMLRVFG